MKKNSTYMNLINDEESKEEHQNSLNYDPMKIKPISESKYESVYETVPVMLPLQLLLQRSEIVPLNNNRVRIIFRSTQSAKEFQSELLKIGFENRGMKGAARKIEVLESSMEDSAERYAIELTAVELEALSPVSVLPQQPLTQFNKHSRKSSENISNNILELPTRKITKLGWYADAEISLIIRLKIEKIAGYAENKKFLLRGWQAGKFPDEDSNHYYVFVTPAIDTFNNPLDFYFNKEKQNNPGPGRRDERKDIFDEIIPIISNDDLYIKILFPYNITSADWLTGEIKIHKSKRTYNIQLTTHHPKGNGEISPSSYKTLCSTLNNKIKSFDSKAITNFTSIMSICTPRQSTSDTTSGSMIVIEDTIKRITGAPLSLKKSYSIGASELQDKHITLVKEYLPTSDVEIIAFLKNHELSNSLVESKNMLKSNSEISKDLGHNLDKAYNDNLGKALHKVLELKLGNFIAQGYALQPSIEEISKQLEKKRLAANSSKLDCEKLVKAFLSISSEDLSIAQLHHVLGAQTGIEITFSEISKAESKIEPALLTPTIEHGEKLPEIDLIFKSIGLGQNEASKVEDKEVVLFLGNTGSGKSTMINYLHGCKLTLEEDIEGKPLIVVNKDSEIEEIATMGHQENSMTLIPSIYSTENIVYVDCPGFFDNRGEPTSIANIINIKNIIQSAKSIKIVILVSIGSLNEERGALFDRLKDMIHGLFGNKDNVRVCGPSILTIFTKLDWISYKNNKYLDSKKIKLSTEMPCLQDNILFFDASDKNKLEVGCMRDEIIEKIISLDPIEKEQKNKFKTELVEKELLYLINMEKIIANIIDQSFENKLFNEVKQCLDYLNYLNIVDNKDINELYTKSLENVASHFEALKINIIKASDECDFKAAEERITEFKNLVKLFERIQNYSELLSEAEQHYKKIRIKKSEDEVREYGEKLSEILQKHDLKIAYAIYAILELDRKMIEPEEIRDHIYDLLVRLGQISDIREPVYNLINSLVQLSLLAKDREYLKCKLEYANTLAILLGNTTNLVQGENQRKIKIITEKIKEHLKEINENIIGKPDSEVFLKQMKSLDFKNFSGENVSTYLTKVNSIKNFIIYLTEDLVYLKNEGIKFSSFENAYKDCKEKILKSLKKLKIQLEEAKANEIISLIESALKMNDFINIGKNFSEVNALAEKLIVPIQIKIGEKVVELEQAAIENLTLQNYSITKSHLNWLIQLHNEFTGIRINLDIPEKTQARSENTRKVDISQIIQTISNNIVIKIHNLNKDIQKELGAAFDDLLLCQENLQDSQLFKNLIYFSNACKEFKAWLKGVSEQHSALLEFCETIIRERFKRLNTRIQIYNSRIAAKEPINPNERVNPTEIVNLFIQARRVILSTNVPKLMIQLDEQIRHVIQSCYGYEVQRIGNKLVKLQNDTEFGRYASEILDKYPQFIRINIENFNKKVLNRGPDDIFKDLKIEKNSILGKSFYAYKEAYDSIIQILIRAFREESVEKKLKTDLEGELIKEAKEQANQLSRTENFSAHPAEVGKLLANIFGMWSYIDACKGGFMDQQNTLLQPHATQIISILLLFGLDENQPIQNHFLQVNTGEGKSVIASGAAIALALLNYKIDIACFSPYLAFRDQEQFKQLFNKFGVTDAIRYDEFGALIDTRTIEKVGDLRKLAENILADKLNEETRILNNSKKVLFIDEVDVFFSNVFLGKTYNPCIIIPDPNFQELLKEIWEKRTTYLTGVDRETAKNNIKDHPLMKNFLIKYRNAYKILDITIERILTALNDVENGRHSYICTAAKGIGYKDAMSGIVNYNLFYKYHTIFAYTKESHVLKEMISEKIGFILTAGYISYTELPKSYQLILGVTGTLPSQTAYENTYIKDYKIDKRTDIPSMFDKKSIENIEIKVCGGKMDAKDATSYFFNIKQEIVNTIQKDRAILVVFEDNERLEAFKAYFDSHSSAYQGRKYNELTPATLQDAREFIISSASARGSITFLTKAFGRGCDFICRDSEVIQKGGVHVVQTFFSEHQSEEIQIKGRTCRQDDLGSYMMILFLDDLKKYGIKMQSEFDEFREKNPTATNAKYDFLKLKRATYQESKKTDLEQSLKIAEEYHNKTMQFTYLLKKHSLFPLRPSNKEKQEALELLYQFQL